MKAQNSTYLNLIDITGGYLGPAAERFIDRQIQNHLNKDPEKITNKDITKLIDWIRTSVSLLTDNEQLVDDYIAQLQHLSKNGEKPSKKGV